MCAGEINPGRRIDVPAWRETYLMDKLFQCCVCSKRLMHRCFSLSAWTLGAPLTSSNRRHPVVRSIGVFYWMDLLFLTCTLRNWNPRPACGTAIKSVRISMSVFGFVPTRDEPAECLPWTRRTGVCPCSPALGTQMSAADSRWPRPYVR